MKAIFTAHLNTIGTTDMNGNNCEWARRKAARKSTDANGMETSPDMSPTWSMRTAMKSSTNMTRAIHNLPEGAIVIACNGEPYAIYWAEEVEGVRMATPYSERFQSRPQGGGPLPVRDA